MKKTNFDSDFCGNLPLHIINSIQPYGVLLLIDRMTLKILQVSENIIQLFHIALKDVLQNKVESFLYPEDLETFKAAIGQYPGKSKFVLNISFGPGTEKKVCLCTIHVSEKIIIFEIEQVKDSISNFTQTFQDIRYGMDLLNNAKDISELCSIAVKEIKKISGYDKVMIYHFDQDWNGTVLAEEKENDMDSYLGLWFPGSDIPRQARALYMKNSYRFIPDRSFEPVKLQPVLNPQTFTYSDLSDCNLRGVAPVHLEYLQNMKVQASMSAAIIKDNQLWGLITCHHKTAKVPEYAIRTSFVFFSNVFTATMRTLESDEILLKKRYLEQLSANLFSRVAANENLGEALLGGQQNILTLLNAVGAVYHSERGSFQAGEVPSKDLQEEIIHWLSIEQKNEVLTEDSIISIVHFRNEEDKVFSGFISIPIDAANGEYIIAFRKEAVQTIMWSGNPNNAIVMGDEGNSYHPRNSFEVWKETVQNKSDSWSPLLVEVAERLKQSILDVIKYKSIQTKK